MDQYEPESEVEDLGMKFYFAKNEIKVKKVDRCRKIAEFKGKDNKCVLRIKFQVPAIADYVSLKKILKNTFFYCIMLNSFRSPIPSNNFFSSTFPFSCCFLLFNDVEFCVVFFFPVKIDFLKIIMSYSTWLLIIAQTYVNDLLGSCTFPEL
jgi:hypothetical protein